MVQFLKLAEKGVQIIDLTFAKEDATLETYSSRVKVAYI